MHLSLSKNRNKHSHDVTLWLSKYTTSTKGRDATRTQAVVCLTFISPMVPTCSFSQRLYKARPLCYMSRYNPYYDLHYPTYRCLKLNLRSFDSNLNEYNHGLLGHPSPSLGAHCNRNVFASQLRGRPRVAVSGGLRKRAGRRLAVSY